MTAVERRAVMSPCGDCGMPTTPYRDREPADGSYERYVRRGGQWYELGGGDLGVEVDGAWEWYMVTDEVWEEAHDGEHGRGYLCVGCLEKRLGRQLTARDFTLTKMNAPSLSNSPRLADRLVSS
jgi:hypothetical protein